MPETPTELLATLRRARASGDRAALETALETAHTVAHHRATVHLTVHAIWLRLALQARSPRAAAFRLLALTFAVPVSWFHRYRP